MTLNGVGELKTMVKTKMDKLREQLFNSFVCGLDNEIKKEFRYQILGRYLHVSTYKMNGFFINTLVENGFRFVAIKPFSINRFVAIKINNSFQTDRDVTMVFSFPKILSED